MFLYFDIYYFNSKLGSFYILKPKKNIFIKEEIKDNELFLIQEKINNMFYFITTNKEIIELSNSLLFYFPSINFNRQVLFNDKNEIIYSLFFKYFELVSFGESKFLIDKSVFKYFGSFSFCIQSKMKKKYINIINKNGFSKIYLKNKLVLQKERISNLEDNLYSLEEIKNTNYDLFLEIINGFYYSIISK